MLQLIYYSPLNIIAIRKRVKAKKVSSKEEERGWMMLNNKKRKTSYKAHVCIQMTTIIINITKGI